MGLGSGGYSRLGLQKLSRLGPTRSGASATLCALCGGQLDCGINLLDTAQVYGTEAIIGKAIRQTQRETIVLSTKGQIVGNGKFLTAQALQQSIDRSLATLNTDYIDIFHLRGVKPKQYDYAFQELVPALLAASDAGKIRFLGITEGFSQDTNHKMLVRAVEDDCWDVVMVGFNLLNQSARDRVFHTT